MARRVNGGPQGAAKELEALIMGWGAGYGVTFESGFTDDEDLGLLHRLTVQMRRV